MPSTNLGCGTKSGCSHPANTNKQDGNREGIRREGGRAGERDQHKGREGRNIPLQPSSFLETASTNLQEQSGRTHSVPRIVRRSFSYSPLGTTRLNDIITNSQRLKGREGEEMVIGRSIKRICTYIDQATSTSSGQYQGTRPSTPSKLSYCSIT